MAFSHTFFVFIPDRGHMVYSSLLAGKWMSDSLPAIHTVLVIIIAPTHPLERCVGGIYYYEHALQLLEKQH